MNAEIASFDSTIRSRLALAIGTLDGLTDAQLNWRPPVDGANSAYALAAHTLGNARAWVLGIACAQPIGRDRPAEFAAAGEGAAQLRRDLDALLSEITAALAALDPAGLDRLLVPSRELWGENQPREISVRYALMQVVEHASMHLGHLQMTRDLALKMAATP